MVIGNIYKYISLKIDLTKKNIGKTKINKLT